MLVVITSYAMLLNPSNNYMNEKFLASCLKNLNQDLNLVLFLLKAYVFNYIILLLSTKPKVYTRNLAFSHKDERKVKT